MRIKNDRLTKGWDSLGRDELRDLQGRRLHAFLTRHVVPFSEYYRGLFNEAGVDPESISTLEDLERVPFSSKRSLIS